MKNFLGSGKSGANALSKPVFSCWRFRAIVFQCFCFFLLLFCVTACDGNYLVWSSDGQLAAAVGAKGLRVCDGEGAISKVLIEKAGLFRFVPQEHQGVYSGYEYVDRWNDLKPLLGVERQKRIEAESEKLKRRLADYHGDSHKFAENCLRDIKYPLEATLKLRQFASPHFQKTACRKWNAYASVKVPVFFVKLLKLDFQSAVVLKTVDRGIDEAVELRVSPSGKFVACVKYEKDEERNVLEIIPLSTGAKSYRAAVGCNMYPDWSQDGRYIYYSCSSGGDNDLIKAQSIREGALFRTEVADSSGKIIANPRQQKLAGLVFDKMAPVRALKDGRVLFASREMGLPSGLNSKSVSALFAFQSNRCESLLRRADDIIYFEPSPEQDQIAVCLASGALLVVGADCSAAVEICNGKDLRVSGIFPQWKSNQELSFGAEQKDSHGANPTYSVQLWSRSGMKDLSSSWGKETSSELIMHPDIFQEAMSGVVEQIEGKAAAPHQVPGAVPRK